jgi:ribosomal protein S18 acetylase RimI-like enzyme
MKESRLDLKKRRIREFFSTFKLKPKEKEEDIDKIQEKVFQEGMVYIQMKLPVEKITPEFEAELIETIEKNFIHANIREATRKDLKILMDLYNKAWLTSNTPFRPITIDSLRQIIEDPDTVFLISKVYGIDAGFVILDFEGKNKEYGIIAGLGVLPRFQRKGLGTILGMAAWNYFKNKGVIELRCEVYKNNLGSHSFIKWIGFEEYKKMLYRKEDFLIEEEIE